MLPPLPKLSLDLDAEHCPDGAAGFLHLRRMRCRVRFEDGSHSQPFEYDAVGRARLDAVVIAAHYRDAEGRRHVFLRSALRPPVFTRPREQCPLPERPELGGLWELPAGLVEPDERSPDGLVRCVVRELEEELGFVVPSEHIHPLGPSTFPAPGIIAERHWYFHVEVDPMRRSTPTEDGSALEQGAAIVALPIDVALVAARRGLLEDAKTELGIRRLAELPAPGATA